MDKTLGIIIIYTDVFMMNNKSEQIFITACIPLYNIWFDIIK